MTVTAMEPADEYEYRLIWEARLPVDQKDPFFFDHPLDHVPAMLLVEGALWLADRAAAAVVGSPRRRHIGRIALRFHRFCELSPEPVIRVWSAADGPGRWHVEFVQDGEVITTGELEWRRGTVPPEPEHRPHDVTPVTADLVHRARPQNVLIGDYAGAVQDDQHQVELLMPGPGHHFRRRSPQTRSFGELIEALRQFGVLLAHEARDVALGRQFVVKTLEAELDRPLSRSEAVRLRSAGLPRHRGRGAGEMSFTVHTDQASPVGAARISGTVLSAEAYQRVRGMAR